MTLEDLQHGLEQGFFSSTDLVEVMRSSSFPPRFALALTGSQAYLERIRQVNDQVHAVTEVNPDAIDIARRLDNERKENAVRGFVHSFMMIYLVEHILTSRHAQAASRGSRLAQKQHRHARQDEQHR